MPILAFYILMDGSGGSGPPGPPSTGIAATADISITTQVTAVVVLNAMPNQSVVYWNNNNLIEVNNLFDQFANAYINSTDVEFEIISKEGPFFGPYVMSYVAASNGDYKGVFPQSDSQNLVVGNYYALQISVTTIAGTIGWWVIPIKAQMRQNI